MTIRWKCRNCEAEFTNSPDARRHERQEPGHVCDVVKNDGKAHLPMKLRGKCRTMVREQCDEKTAGELANEWNLQFPCHPVTVEYVASIIAVEVKDCPSPTEICALRVALLAKRMGFGDVLSQDMQKRIAGVEASMF